MPDVIVWWDAGNKEIHATEWLDFEIQPQKMRYGTDISLEIAKKASEPAGPFNSRSENCFYL